MEDSRRRDELRSVRNAARLLKEFSPTDTELGVSELARRLGLGVSTVHRLLTAMTEERLLDRGEVAGRYRLGLALYAIGANVVPRTKLHEAALPVMNELRHRTGETVHIAVLDGVDVVFVDRLEGLDTAGVFVGLGNRLPAHRTSTGKVLLAALPAETRYDVLRSMQWTAAEETSTTCTILDPDELNAQLDKVAERGWAQNLQESRAGIASLGAPVRGGDGEVVAGLSVAWPVGLRPPERVRRYKALVIEAAAMVSARMGAPRLMTGGTVGREPPAR
ncbi:MAG: IclR family transcriptional regulator [Pseudonocardia sp.]